MDLGIKGKTALILCAGGGLGRAIAKAMAKEGVALALSDVDREALSATVNELADSGAAVLSEALDLADLEGMQKFIELVNQKRQHIDILVNISGGPPPGTAAKVPPEKWESQFKAMFVSMVYVTDLVLPCMRANRWGRIITSTSSGVVAPIANLGISNSLRSALVGWSKTLAREVASDGITANIVVPGRIATARVQQLDEARAAREGRTREEIVKSSVNSIPVGRYGEPEEYADVVTFLASAKASYITGAMIRVDGGMIQSI